MLEPTTATTPATEPTQVAPTTPAAPIAAPAAPAAAPTSFTPEQIEEVNRYSPEQAREFVRGLTEDQRKLLAQPGGLKNLLPPAAQGTDPASAAASPAAVAEPAAPVVAEPAQPAGEPAPSWAMTEEQIASATPEHLTLYKEYLDLREEVESAKPPELDPIYSDPRIEFVKQVIQTGQMDLPQVTIDDLVKVSGGTIDDLYKAIDEAHVSEDPNAWANAVTKLAAAVSKETQARMRISLEARVAEAREEGAKAVEFKYGLQSFLDKVPEFKGAEPLYSESGSLNPKSPAVEFVKFLSQRENADAFGEIFSKYGVNQGLNLAWTQFQSQKAGGYNKFMAGIRTQEAKSLLQRQRELVNASLAKSAAPSVGTVQAPANGGNLDFLYHGHDLRAVSTPEQARKIYMALRTSGNIAGAEGLASALAKASR